MIAHLFTDWNRVVSRIRAAPATALFLDFDGTLSRLRPRPEQAVLYQPLRPVLSALARSPRFRVCVISGRRLADVRSKIRVPRIRYLGLHGWEQGEGNSLSRSARKALPQLEAAVVAAVAAIPGIWVEDKGHAFTVHHREAEEADARLARSLLDASFAPFSRLFHIQCGKCVWEVLPREIGNKGVAVRRQLAFLATTVLPVYIGDDRVDEPAFATLREGVTIRVGNGGMTRARYRLNGVDEVSDFLQRLKEEFA